MHSFHLPKLLSPHSGKINAAGASGDDALWHEYNALVVYILWLTVTIRIHKAIKHNAQYNTSPELAAVLN